MFFDKYDLLLKYSVADGMTYLEQKYTRSVGEMLIDTDY